MPKIQVKKVGNSAALFLNKEIMQLLAIHIGDEVDVRIENRNIVIQASDEILREQKLKKVTNNVFERRKSAYQKLAKGVS